MKKRALMRVLGAWMMMMVLLGTAFPGQALEQSRNPLVDPKPLGAYTETEDEFFNILLLGIDLGYPGYLGSFGTSKKQLHQCHTDSVMVVSINKTKNKVNLISVPRDSLTYVPGVQGIYKLNGAFNAAATVEEGLMNTCNAVSWFLGGVRIDRYCAVDMKTMVALGDAMGGVDFEMDMSYKGSSGKYYRKGPIHLDGLGITDYLRARQNATVDYNDIGRTRRNRAMIKALYEKLLNHPELILPLMQVIESDEYTFLTNATKEEFLQVLLPLFQGMKTDEIGAYVLDGGYRSALVDFNFTFNKQDVRKDVIRQAFGLEAEELPYVSVEYTRWLVDTGFITVRYIHVARQLIDYCQKVENPTQRQQEMLAEFIAMHDACVRAFDQAADTMSSADNRNMSTVRRELRALGDKLGNAFSYPKAISWYTSTLWYKDPLINAWQIDWR